MGCLSVRTGQHLAIVLRLLAYRLIDSDRNGRFGNHRPPRFDPVARRQSEPHRTRRSQHRPHPGRPRRSLSPSLYRPHRSRILW